MRALALAAVCTALLTSAVAEESDPLTARVHALVVQLADPLNDARSTPGADLLILPDAALPALRAEFAQADLAWWTKTGLQRAIDQLTAHAEGQALEPYTRAAYASYQAGLIGRWRKGGLHDARWDAAVEECLSALAMEWSDHPGRRGDELERARAACERALQAGCADPYITYLDGRLRWLTDGMVDETSTALIQKAAAGITGSCWNPIDQCFVLWRGALTIQWGWKWKPEGEQARQVEAWVGAIPELLVAAAKDPQTRQDSLLMLANAYIDFMHQWKGQRVEAFRALFGALDAAIPKSAIPPLLCAKFDVAWAWDARGSGWASTVTEEGWRQMRERMAQAQAALARADQRDPHCLCVPLVALELANGSSYSYEEAIGWLERSMALHPGHRDGLYDLAGYLEPKWHGTPEQLLALGRHCLALGDWANRTPQVLLSVHGQLARYGDQGWTGSADPTYLRNDEVWKDVEAVFTGWLAHTPDDPEARSQYLWYAYAAGKTDLARSLDESLHGRPRLESLGGAEGYRRIHAELHAGSATSDPHRIP